MINATNGTLLLAAILVMGGCLGVRIADPLPSHRDPVTGFNVEFHPNYIGPFQASLDGLDWTNRFSPSPQPGGTSFAPVVEPFWGGSPSNPPQPMTLPPVAQGSGTGGGTGGAAAVPSPVPSTGGTAGGPIIPSYLRYEHTLEVHGDAKWNLGFPLDKHRGKVTFSPVHVVFNPNNITFRAGQEVFVDVCLVPAPTRAVEVTVMPLPDAVTLILGAAPPGQGIVISIVPQPSTERVACTQFRVSATRASRPAGILGLCNGCQVGSANVAVSL